MVQKKFEDVFAPDIADLARRGGLNDGKRGAVPYQIDVEQGQLYLSRSGLGTPTVRWFALQGLNKSVADARNYCVKFPQSSPAKVRLRFGTRGFGVMSDRWIKEQVIDKRNEPDTGEAAAQIDSEIEKSLPELAALPGSRGRRPGRPQSEIVATRRPVIKKIASTGVTGEAYCRALDAAGLITPIEWQKREGCPKSYFAAWDHSDPDRRQKFRKLIKSEKYKNTRSPKLA